MKGRTKIPPTNTNKRVLKSKSVLDGMWGKRKFESGKLIRLICDEKGFKKKNF